MSVKITKYGDPLKGSQMTIDQGNIEVCAKIVAQAKTLAPVAQKFGGTLRNSYMYKVNTIEGEKEGLFNNQHGEKAKKKVEYKPKKNEGVVGSNVDYAAYQEFGTRKMVAQPHLRPAVDIVMGRSAKSVLKDVADLQMKQALKLGKKVKSAR